MIPLRLRVIPREVQPEGKKKIVHVLDLKLGAQLGLRELQALAQSEGKPLLALPSLDDHVPPDDLFPVEAAAYEDDEEPAEGEVVEISEDLSGDIEPDALDSQIADLQAALGYNQAKMTMRWQKVQGDKQAMLDLLTQEYEDGDGNAPAKPEKPKPAAPSTSAVPGPKQGGFLI